MPKELTQREVNKDILFKQLNNLKDGLDISLETGLLGEIKTYLENKKYIEAYNVSCELKSFINPYYSSDKNVSKLCTNIVQTINLYSFEKKKSLFILDMVDKCLNANIELIKNNIKKIKDFSTALILDDDEVIYFRILENLKGIILKFWENISKGNIKDKKYIEVGSNNLLKLVDNVSKVFKYLLSDSISKEEKEEFSSYLESVDLVLAKVLNEEKVDANKANDFNYNLNVCLASVDNWGKVNQENYYYDDIDYGFFCYDGVNGEVKKVRENVLYRRG